MVKKSKYLISKNLTKYSKESGKKTLILVVTLIISIIAILTITLIIMNKPTVLTSSINTKITPANTY